MTAPERVTLRYSYPVAPSLLADLLAMTPLTAGRALPSPAPPAPGAVTIHFDILIGR
jgi:hypothetical protein